MRNKLAILALLLVVAAVGGFLYKKYRVAPAIAFAPLQLTDLQGAGFELRDNTHKVYVVNFFATWCGPCIRELPSLAYVAHYYSKQNWKFVCVSDESVERLQQLAKVYANENLLFARSTVPLKELQIYTVPTTYILNSQLEILYKTTNGENWMSGEMIKRMDQITTDN